MRAFVFAGQGRSRVAVGIDARNDNQVAERSVASFLFFAEGTPQRISECLRRF
jgi:hypothetical protein